MNEIQDFPLFYIDQAITFAATKPGSSLILMGPKARSQHLRTRSKLTCPVPHTDTQISSELNSSCDPLQRPAHELKHSIGSPKHDPFPLVFCAQYSRSCPHKFGAVPDLFSTERDRRSGGGRAVFRRFGYHNCRALNANGQADEELDSIRRGSADFPRGGDHSFW